MEDINKIDMFKNDVNYRENIAHIQTIPRHCQISR